MGLDLNAATIFCLLSIDEALERRRGVVEASGRLER